MEEQVNAFLLFEDLSEQLICLNETPYNWGASAASNAAFNKKVILVHAVKETAIAANVLGKILNASSWTFDDVLILEWNELNPFTWTELIARFNPSAVFLFDIAPADLRCFIAAQVNDVIEFNTVKLIISAALNQIDADRNTKLSFWKVWTQQLGIQPKK